MDRLRDDLVAETAKWAARLDAALRGVTAKDEEGERFLENIKAYRRDSDHFVTVGDLVRAFECIVWAWAWIEIGRDAGHLAGVLPP